MRIDLEKIEGILEPLATSLGCELVACEWASDLGRRILRVFIDKEDGVMLEDCESFSRLIDPLLDVEGLVPEKYDLEVSSPGLNRPLRKQKDFEKFTGECVSIKTSEPLNNRSNYKGLLQGVKGQTIQLEIDHEIFEIPLNLILKANLEFNIGKLLKKKKK